MLQWRRHGPAPRGVFMRHREAFFACHCATQIVDGKPQRVQRWVNGKTLQCRGPLQPSDLPTPRQTGEENTATWFNPVQTVESWRDFHPVDFRNSVRGALATACVAPNGLPNTVFGAVECARSCTGCKSCSSPRYTPSDSLNPLTGGRFDSKIHTVRQERF